MASWVRVKSKAGLGPGGEVQLAEESSSNGTSNGIPKWVIEKVVPKAEAPVRSVHLLKGNKSAMLFTEEGAFVAERRFLGGIKVYDVPYPDGLVVNDSECPHCGEVIRTPVRKVAQPKGKGSGKAAGKAKASRGAATAKKPAQKTGGKPKTTQVYPGKAVDVIDVEGIGPTYAKRLEAAGIKTTEDLLRTVPEELEQVAQANATNVTQWRAMAELMRVKDVGKQFAELLVRSDIKSVKELAQQDAAKLLKRMKFAQSELDVKIQGAPLNTKRVGGWIRNAKAMKPKRVPTR